MKTLNQLKEVAENKGLKFEVNVWDPTLTRLDLQDGKTPDPNFLKVEIGIRYKKNTWAWWSAGFFNEEEIKKGEMTLYFRSTYNQNMGAEDKSWKRGYSVENQLFEK